MPIGVEVAERLVVVRGNRVVRPDRDRAVLTELKGFDAIRVGLLPFVLEMILHHPGDMPGIEEERLLRRVEADAFLEQIPGVHRTVLETELRRRPARIPHLELARAHGQPVLAPAFLVTLIP